MGEVGRNSRGELVGLVEGRAGKGRDVVGQDGVGRSRTV